MHEATLLTGDLDFKPLLDALVLEGMFVSLWYPKGGTSKELIAAADKSYPLSAIQLHSALPSNKPRPFDIPNSYAELSKGDYAAIVKTWDA